jgi:DNA ligase-1
MRNKMNSTEIVEMLNVIGEEQSKNVKIELLKEFLDDEDFLKVIQFAYNPFIRFNILKVKETSVGDRDFNEDTWHILVDLCERRISGNIAYSVVMSELGSLNSESQELFKMILNKDLRAGFGTKSINKARKNTIPELPYMRCSLQSEVKMDELKWTEGLYSQLKADGMFVNVTHTKHILDVLSRSGQQFKSIPIDFLMTLGIILDRDYQYHGELLVVEDGKVLDRKTGNGILNSLMKGGELASNQYLRFVVWDMVSVDVLLKLEPSPPYSSRFKALSEMLSKVEQIIIETRTVSLIETKLVFSIEEARAHFQEQISAGLEGTILKTRDGKWKDGTSKHQIKFKEEYENELQVIDFIDGTGKWADTFGSLLCMSSCGRVLVGVSGFTDRERKDIWENKNDWLGSIVTVKYNQLIDSKELEEKSLFLPRFVEKRNDKHKADSLEIIMKTCNRN